MARNPSKHGRDQALDWELSVKDKDKKMKPQAPQKEKLASSRNTGKTPTVDYSSNSGQFDYTRNYGVNPTSSGFMTEESSPDANSEKELGNEYFKQKKFKEAIECYSRSIALFQEAENDCTEALNLDDRYIKAYSRRATARKELGKSKECFEDAEFALRLEPNNQEIKKQYTEARSLYDKAIIQKLSGPPRSSEQGRQKVGSSESKINGSSAHPVPNNSQRSGVSSVQDHTKDNDEQFPVRASVSVEEIESKSVKAGSRIEGQEAGGSRLDAIQSSKVDSVKVYHEILAQLSASLATSFVSVVLIFGLTGKQDLMKSVQELASQAASRAKAEAAKNITPPNSAYQFEASWRGLSGDRALQARLLKAVSPTALPQIFKNALSASLLVDIIKCVATFFIEEMDLAIGYIENLTKVSRFDILIMCLSSAEKDDLHKIWDEVFCSEATPIEYAEMLDKLRSRYCLKQ
uniref:RNA-polymerase II-associated protein 3-like C-terminal domain-containing protein n=1 Tax=Fagus sylvatica TaxID=28930 RepID=A0A2N9EQ25_FAGSY